MRQRAFCVGKQNGKLNIIESQALLEHFSV